MLPVIYFAEDNRFEVYVSVDFYCCEPITSHLEELNKFAANSNF